MSSEADFNKDMNQFIHLLKKILKNYQMFDKQNFPQSRKNNDINVNLFIFPLIPLTPEEMDELEELYENYMLDDDRSPEDLTADLTESDRDFLRRNGIRF